MDKRYTTVPCLDRWCYFSATLATSWWEVQLVRANYEALNSNGLGNRPLVNVNIAQILYID